MPNIQTVIQLLENLRLLQEAHVQLAVNLGQLRRDLQIAAQTGDRTGLCTLAEAAERVVNRLVQ